MALVIDSNNQTSKSCHQIAQDVMSLFQIVDAEKDLNAVFDDLQIQQQPQQKKKVPPPVPPKRTNSSAESVKVTSRVKSLKVIKILFKKWTCANALEK